MIDRVTREGRITLRQWQLRPAFLLGVVASITLGVGATTLMAEVLNALLFQPPSHLADGGAVKRLFLRKSDPLSGGNSLVALTNYPTLLDVRGAAAFSDVAAYTVETTSIGQGASTVRGDVAFATLSYFQLLGTRPAAGRFFSGSIDGQQPDVVVLSYALWCQTFGGMPSILGRRIAVDGVPREVIGVAPPGFTGVERQYIEAWVPLANGSVPRTAPRRWRTDRESFWLRLVARLRQGVPAHSAEQIASATVRHQLAASGTFDTLVTVVAASTIPGRSPDRPAEANVAVWLGAVSVLVLVLAAANAAVLITARSLQHQGDIAIRKLLGARAVDLALSFFVEAAMLSLLSGTAVVLLVRMVRPAVERLLLPDLVWPEPASALATGSGAAVLAFLLVLAMNALIVRGSTQQAHEGRLGVAGSRVVRGGARPIHLLLGLQAAICVVLVFGAAVFSASLRRVESLDLGIDIDQTLMVVLPLDDRSTRADRIRSYSEAARRLGAIAGVDHVSVADGDPYLVGRAAGPHTDDRDFLTLWSNREVPYATMVGSGFFAAVGARSLMGRDFTDADRVGSPQVVIINRPLAEWLWPGQRAVGKRLWLGNNTPATVVGVVNGVWKLSLLDRHKMAVYLPLAQDSVSSPAALFVHSTRNVTDLKHAVAASIAAALPDRAPPVVTLMREEADPTYRPWQLGATMFSAFGAMAVVIAAIGLYSFGVYATTQRQREIALRLAIGAPARHLMSIVAGRNVCAGLLGSIVGAALVAIASRWAAGVLYQTSPKDPVLLCGTILFVVGTLLIASVVPVVRQIRRPHLGQLLNE